MAKLTKAQQAEREAAIAKLQGWIKPGSTVQTILRHCSRSGMARSISLVIPVDGETMDISYWAARAMNDKIDQNNGGIKIGGCGQDMGYALVYNLSRTLFHDGFDCIGKDCRCPSNDHSNGDRNYSPDNHHTDGGYALKHRWL